MRTIYSSTAVYCISLAALGAPTPEAPPKVAGAPVATSVVIIGSGAKLEDAAQRGCWAKLYADHQYKGDSLMLIGAMELADMKGPFGINWQNQVRSVQVGPRAGVTIFDNKNLTQKVAQIEPGKEVPVLDDKLGMFQELRSLRIDCR